MTWIFKAYNQAPNRITLPTFFANPDVSIAGSGGEIMVDTGADHMYIDDVFARTELRLAPTREPAKVRQPGADAVKRPVALVDISVGDPPTITRKLPAILIPDLFSDLGVEGLVGMKFLKDFQFAYYFNTNRHYFGLLGLV